MGSMAKVMQKIRGAGGDSDESPAASTDAAPVNEELIEEPLEVAAEIADASSEEAGSCAEVQPAAAGDTSCVLDDIAENADQTDVEADGAGGDDPATVAGDGEPAESTAFVPSEPARPEPDPEQDDQEVSSAAGPAGRGAIARPDETVEWSADKVDPVVLAFHDRYAAICEQYRSIRARLLTMNSAHNPQMLVITSAIPEEGKSVSTVNLGLIMAEGGEHRILIIDADFRRPSIPRMLGLDDHTGLADVLRGDVSLDEAIQPTPFPNLKLLSAGKMRDTSHSELLGGQSTETVLDELRHQFDYTLVDTPPVTTVSDVCLLAPHCDGAIVVVQMRRTPEPTVQQAIRTLQANNVKVVGSILSKSHDRGSGYYASYYSSYYYR